MAAQSLTTQHPTAADLERAFADLLINKTHAPPARAGHQFRPRPVSVRGRRATARSSIAERVTRAFGQYIWIPRCIGVDGEIIRLYDPNSHEEVPLENGAGPAGTTTRSTAAGFASAGRPIIVGGELTMDNLEVTLNTVDRHQRGAAAAQEQLRHAGHRRLRPAADEHRRAAQPLDRAAGKALRLS